MPLTFEERISEDLDALYAGAAFLSGSQGDGAHRLLVEAVSVASAEYSEDVEGGDFTRWMEDVLVSAFLSKGRGRAGSDKAPAVEHRSVSLEQLERIGWADMVRSAAGVPPRPRAALWLVLLRRWRYSDAATSLGVDVESLRGLLAYRETFFRALVVGSVDAKARDTGS